MITIIIFFCLLIFSIVIHEFSHGLVAYRLGDPTPKVAGRLTFNPLNHLDWFGSVIFPVLAILLTLGMLPLGYARPIPINPYNFRNPRKDIMWVGIAGPLSNLLFAFFLSLLTSFPLPYTILKALVYGISVNITFFVFNLIPIPPLDGSKILAACLSYRVAYRYLKMQLYGILFLFVLLGTGLIRWFITPCIYFFLNLFGVRLSLL